MADPTPDESRITPSPVDSSYDIVVVGAGPAGSTAAQSAARAGVRVLLIDRRQRIGVPVQCAELVSQWIFRHARFSSNCVLRTIEKMVTHLPDGASHEMRGPGYMLDRSLFDKELAASAVLSGAGILIETKAVGVSSEGVIIQRGEREELIRTKIIIGADGVHSSVARWVGLPPSKTLVALQYEVIDPNPSKDAEIFFYADYEGGYGWLFPKGKTANAGLGVLPRKTSSLSSLMNDFLRRLVDSGRLSCIEIVGKTGGAIPCGKPGQTVFGNVLLVGDAAGHAHSITGGGILNAVIGGEIAGRVAAEAVTRRDLNYLQTYEMEWREAFGEALAYAASKREFLEENWNRRGLLFNDLIRKTWVGFKQYYEERKKIPLRSPFL